MGADKTNNIMTLSSGVSQPLLADVQYFELYSSSALNRKLKNIVLPGFYCGFEPVPGTGLSVRITSENSEGKGAASVDVNNVQISVQQIEDVTVSVKAGATNIIVLEANFEHGVKTTQVDSASSVSAARIYARTDNTIGQNQIELCRVIVPSGATAVTKEMIVLKYRVNRAVGVEFSNEISSTEERKAATPLAVKTLHDLVDTKAPINSPNLTGTPTTPTAPQGTNNTQIASTAFVMAAIAALVDSSPDALNTLNELAAALGNDPNFSATVTRLIGEKVAKDGDTMTGKLNLPQTSAFGINTNNRLGGNSLTLGDHDTGIKQEGDGVLSVFANGQRVFLFTERSITSLKELLIGDARYSTGGDVYGSQWGDGWLSSWLSARFAECANASHNHPWSQITDVPAASLTQSGIVQLSSAINSTSETLAATPKAVKAAYDLAAGKAPSSHTHPWNQITGVPTASLTAKGITQLSSATNSTSEVLAATPKAVKAAYDLANGKYTAQDATTTQKGIVQLSSDTNSTSETLAATPKAVKAAYDLANGKQAADATLTALAALATAADKLPYFTGVDRAALTALTSVGRAILSMPSIQGVLNYLGLGEGSALPVGVPVPWPSATPPTGWLKCNGAAFSSEKYPNLAKAYPTLKLPDLRGEFIRGWDDGRGLDAGRALLSLQDDSFEAHRHESFFYAGISRNETPLKNLPSSDEMLTLSSTTNALSPDSIDATNSLIGNDDYNCLIEGNKNNKRTATGLSTSIVGTAETRPRNVAFNYIVRAA
ncbi:phage tail protein [Escherichia coli]|uniref:phage tail protein n=1 Tax=Escherichia coli TaxID=562 RepID=UPI000DA52744|nr:putative side tail fiber protein from lambdoid prophage [Escherichia coli]